MENLFGILLRQWRGARNVSQLDLALRAACSQRHVSFVESARTRPSREMVLKLAEALDVPLRARNELLLAAGYAPLYRETPLRAAEMEAVHKALERMLGHHEPYPAMVLNSAWNIVMSNRATQRLIARCVSKLPVGELNLLKLMCAPDGLRPLIRSWTRTGPALLARLRREAAQYPDSPSKLLLGELSSALPAFTEPADAPLEVVIPLDLEVNGVSLRLFNTLTMLGTPQDITLQELRIEMSFPADAETDRVLCEWAGATKRADAISPPGKASALFNRPRSNLNY